MAKRLTDEQRKANKKKLSAYKALPVDTVSPEIDMKNRFLLRRN